MLVKRFLALLIDTIVFIVLWFLCYFNVSEYIIDEFGPNDRVFYYTIKDNIWWVLLLVYFIIPEVLFYTTFGKWLFGLKVKKYRDSGGNKRVLMLGRQLLKFFSIFSMIGILPTFIIYGTQGFCWYDKVLGVYMFDSKSDGLTDVQRNWREHFDDKH